MPYGWRILRKCITIFYTTTTIIVCVLQPVAPDMRQVEPEMLSQEKLLRRELGETAIFPCQVRNLGTMVIIWRHGTRVLTAGDLVIKQDDRLKLEHRNLVVGNLTREDAGIYTCEVENEIENPLTVQHKLEILEPPVIESSSPTGEIKVVKGSTVTMRCRASGFPEPQISWKRTMGQVPTSFTSEDTSLLVIHNITRHAGGEYLCQAQNGVGGPARRVVSIVVQYPPEVEAERRQVHTGPGQTMEISCIVYSSPPASVSWYRDTMLLESDNNIYFRHQGTLHMMTIRKVDLSHIGNYSCSASNSFGRGEAAIHVTGSPERPVMLESTSTSSKSFELSWSCVSYSSIVKYRLMYRKLKEDKSSDHFHAWINLLLVPPKQTEENASIHKYNYTIEKLWPDTKYEALVQSYNEFGWSPTSNSFIISTSRSDLLPSKLSPDSDSRDPNPQLILSNSSPPVTTRQIFNLSWLVCAVTVLL